MTTTPFSPTGLASLPTSPAGWPIGSYATYAEAQHAVDHLADKDFPNTETLPFPGVWNICPCRERAGGRVPIGVNSVVMAALIDSGPHRYAIRDRTNRSWPCTGPVACP